MAREIGLLRTEIEETDEQRHSSHRVIDITRIGDESRQSYCLDCEKKFSAGKEFVIKDY
jgi:hypothetical protein